MSYEQQTIETVLMAAGTFIDTIEGDLKAFGPQIGFERLKALRTMVTEAGIGYRTDFFPLELDVKTDLQRERVQPLIEEMAELLDGIAEAGREGFKNDPKKIFQHLLCSVPNGGTYPTFYGLTEEKANIYIADFGDLFIEDIKDELLSLSQYPNLQSLTFFANDMNEFDLGSLPFADLNNLRQLTVCDNQLCDLPSEVTDLPNLESLNLMGNSLSRIWDRFGNMKRLRYLNVNRNCLDKVEIVKLRNLLPDCLIETNDQREW